MPDIKLNAKYEPLWTSDADIYIIYGGRGGAKSFGVATRLTDLLCEDDPHVILYTRYTMTSANMSIIPEFNDKIERLGMIDLFKVNNTDVENLNTENRILFRGIKTSSGNQTARLKSIEGLTTFVIDEAEEFVCETTFDTILYSIRKKGVRNRVFIILNPPDKHHWIYRRFFAPHNLPFDFCGQIGNVCYIYTSYLDNLENLSESFIKQAEELKKINPAKYNHLLLGHWQDETEGAQWNIRTMIDPFRLSNAPELKRLIVSIDPTVTSTGKQDECGIVVCGMDFQAEPHFYVIEDASEIMSPAEWARIGVGAYKNHQCDNIIGESNQGGDLVEMNIKNVDPNVPVKLVRATRGKMKRAEPIAALYEAGRVHHVGHFYELEKQMSTYTGLNDGQIKDDRLDALVWGLTELSQNSNEVGIYQL